MTEPIDAAVVGAGQAGLAASHELTRAGVAHVVLEKGRVGQTWRRRWDSICLVTPNWSVDLPGHPYDGAEPDGAATCSSPPARWPRAPSSWRLARTSGPPPAVRRRAHFLRKRKSSLLLGVGEDAAIVARRIAAA